MRPTVADVSGLLRILAEHNVEFIVGGGTTYTQARATLASLCDRVAETREPYIIERRNGENVALVAEAELNALLETAHLLRSPKNAARLASALQRAHSGKPSPTSLEKVRRSLGLEDEED